VGHRLLRRTQAGVVLPGDVGASPRGRA
jgi:hypothetical protein